MLPGFARGDGGGPKEIRDVSVPSGPGAHAPGRFRSRDRRRQGDGSAQGGRAAGGGHGAGWLRPEQPLPEDAEVAAALAVPRRAVSTVSTLERWREQIVRWHALGVSGVVMHAALRGEHGFTGSYSAGRRMLVDLRAREPAA